MTEQPDPPRSWTRSRPRGRVLAASAVAVGLVVIGAVIAVPLLRGSADASSAGPVPAAARLAGNGAAVSDVQALVVTASSCGAGWSLGSTGAAAFAIANQSGKPAEITLRDNADDAIIAEIEGMPPRVTRQLSTTVNPGSYYWMCKFRDSTSARSPVITVAGPRVPVAEPLLEVTTDDMTTPVAQYKTYVATQLALLKTQTTTLVQDLTAANTTKAKTDWLTAHQTYHRIGAAYNAFGDAGNGIDGLTQGLPGGLGDKNFTGFHQIEHLLWTNTPPRTITPAATRLAAAVAALATKLPTLTFDPNDISLRTHEILEGTARFQLTGVDDYGSGTSLATATADLDGTRTLLKILTPLLQERSPGLPARAGTQLDTLQQTLNTTKTNGQWVPYTHLTLTQRQHLAAATGAALETLSVIPDMLEIRA